MVFVRWWKFCNLEQVDHRGNTSRSRKQMLLTTAKFVLFYRRNTALSLKPNSCIYLFGIPNHIVEYEKKSFTNDYLQQCSFLLDPTFEVTAPVDIILTENFDNQYWTGKRWSSCFALFQKNYLWVLRTCFFILGLNCTQVLTQKTSAALQTEYIAPNKETETKCQEKSYQTEVQKKFQSVIFGKFVFKQGTLFGDSVKYKILFVAEKDSPITLSLDTMIDKIQPYLPFNTSSEKDMSKRFLKHFDRSFQVLEHVVEVSASSWMQNVKIKMSGPTGMFFEMFDRAVEQYGSLNFGQ